MSSTLPCAVTVMSMASLGPNGAPATVLLQSAGGGNGNILLTHSGGAAQSGVIRPGQVSSHPS